MLHYIRKVLRSIKRTMAKTILFFFIFLLNLTPQLSAEKLQNSIPSDYKAESLPTTVDIQVPKTSASSAVTASPAAISVPSAKSSIPTTPTPKVALPSFQKNVLAGQLKPYEPSANEKRFNEMMAAQAAQVAAKKKKKLIDSIMYEITNYGIFIILGLVAAVMIYALRKDRTGPAPITPEDDLLQKKDIWHEDF